MRHNSKMRSIVTGDVMLDNTTTKRIADPLILGEEFDYLALENPSRDPVYCSKTPQKKAAVIATMRDEGLSILEWVAHYQLIGFDSIFIYTNSNTDGSDDLLRALHVSGIITLINNPTPAKLSPQQKAYRHAFWFSEGVADHEWVCFVDADEFLFPIFEGEALLVSPWIDRLRDRFDCSSVALHWRLFHGEGEFEKTDGLLFERYREGHWRNCVKSVFRLRDAVAITAHYGVMNAAARMINASGEVIAKPSHVLPNPTGMLGQINHYWNKSFQEFYVKRERGHGGRNPNLHEWTKFFNRGPFKDAANPYPSHEHIKLVHEEIKILRSLPGVKAAEDKVISNMRALMSSEIVRKTYEDTKQAWHAYAKQAWEERLAARAAKSK